MLPFSGEARALPLVPWLCVSLETNGDPEHGRFPQTIPLSRVRTPAEYHQRRSSVRSCREIVEKPTIRLPRVAAVAPQPGLFTT